MSSLIGIHAILQTIAFVIIFPLGAIVALFREKIGASWFRYHVTLQSLGTLMVIIAVSLAIAYRVTDKHDHKEAEPSETKKRHRKNGYLVVSVLAAQWVWALFVRGLLPWGIWLNIHMLLAALLISLGFYQVYLGTQLISG